MSLNPLELLHQLVAIPSLSGEEQVAAEFLAAQMAVLGLAGRVDAVGNAVGVRECPDENGRISHEIVLLGHIDTVPGEIAVRVENGRLHGRGTVDAKGPLAAFVIAAAGARLPMRTRVVVIGAVEEESATSKGARFAATQYQPDWCVIGEPSGWDAVTLGYKGRLLLDYELSQPMGHTAGPNSEVAETAVAWWNAICQYAAQFNQGRERLFDQLLPSLRQIHTASDGLTNRVTAQVGFRLPPGFDAEAFVGWVRQQADGAALRSYGAEPAFQSGRQNGLAHSFTAAIRQAGARPRLKHKTGTSDMNVVGPVWQCPIVAYGPGDSQLDHTPQEHIVIDDYLRAIAILQTVLESCG